MTSDPIANFITALKNAASAGKESVLTHRSKIKEAIAHTLKDCGYLSDIAIRGKQDNKIEVTLSYKEQAPRIHGMKRVSRPGRRVYVAALDMHPVQNGYGHLIVSTPQGVMTGQAAKKKNVGGEALFEIW